MAVLFEEGGKGGPAAARLLDTDEIAQCVRAPASRGKLLDQTEEPRIERGRTREIQPLDAAVSSLVCGKGGPGPPDRLFHQRQHVPRDSTPRRCHGSVLLRVLGRNREVDIDDEQLARNIEVADAK